MERNEIFTTQISHLPYFFSALKTKLKKISNSINYICGYQFPFKMKQFLYIILFCFLIQQQARSDEGIWIPLYLGELNETEMQSMGMNITADDIYSINHASLKDAILIFGGGCTAEIVSDEGLILTNYHCGYSRIQAHSSLENDYLTNGFWARDRSEELANPGLTVTLLIRMEEVTSLVLEGVSDTMNEADRMFTIAMNIDSVKKEAVKGTHYKAVVRSFFEGNRYFLFVNEVFEDVRLVGAPPSDIGKFGGDTDNWIWPRHTGDFSVFRIYADKDNNPCKYSQENIPYHPKKHLAISLNGVQQGDFTFVFGYPGRTEEYIPSCQISLQVNMLNPLLINLRGKRIEIFKQGMDQSSEIRIQYAAKQASVANGWKKAIGEDRGIKRLNAIENKKQFESAFQEWANSTADLKNKYGPVLPAFEKIYKNLGPLYQSALYIREAGFGVEIIRFARQFEPLVEAGKRTDESKENTEDRIQKLIRSSDLFYKDYQPGIDKKIFVALMSDYYNSNPKEDLPLEFSEITGRYKGDMNRLAEEIFEHSLFASREKMNNFLTSYKKSSWKKLQKDLVYKLTQGFNNYNEVLVKKISQLNLTTDSLMQLYMKGQMEMQPMKLFYPDANSTLRVAYGKVDGYKPEDAVDYEYFTTLKGIIEKEDADVYDYVVENRLKELYYEKDYGRYGDQDGTMHVCFLATNHTSGGNSGSPVLDANGNLIGLNFDRCWEGTMSDLYFDPEQCRNIVLDIRYCLFIIDKFAGAKHLVDEMTIAENE